MVDAVRALADLKSVAAVDSATLPWLTAFDGAGRRALYLFKGDVFTLELARITISALSPQRLRKKLPPASLRTGGASRMSEAMISISSTSIQIAKIELRMMAQRRCLTARCRGFIGKRFLDAATLDTGGRPTRRL